MNYTLFISRLTRFSLVIAAFIGIFQMVQSKIVLPNLIWLALLYYAIVSLATGLITLSGLSKNNKTFMSRTYSSIGIRLVFSLFPLLIYLLFSPQRDFPLIIAYILLYFFFTSFEIYMLVVNLRPDSKK